MAHFAEIDANNQVLRVVVIANADICDDNGSESEALGKAFCHALYDGEWIQTSYNGKIRGKYAGIGDTYNAGEDIFIVPQPHDSWTRDGSYWKPPVPYPTDDKFYEWNESKLRWDAV
jgi:hypothetical protein